MADIPNFPYKAETKEDIRKRMLAEVPDEWDKTEGSFVFDAVSPAASEAARLQERVKDILKRAFVTWAEGKYLEAKAAERGIYRRQATKAKGIIRVEGTPGTKVFGGSRFSTEVDPNSGQEAIVFVTDAYAVIPDTGVVDIPATCTEAGEKGNVRAGQIVVNLDRINGIKSVTNPSAFYSGYDGETDDAFRKRFLESVKIPSSSGNVSDYQTWALEASPLVGRVKVLPTWDGNGTVKVILTDTGLNPAPPDLARAVLDYLDPCYSVTFGKAKLTPGGHGVTDDGTAWVMAYDPAGVGTLSVSLTAALKGNPAASRDGLYRIGVRVLVDSTDGTTDLLRLTVTDDGTGQVVPVTRDGQGQAENVVRASDLMLNYGYVYVDFFWDGAKNLTLTIQREQSDMVTTVKVDSVEVHSQFGGMRGGGIVPIGAKVTVTNPVVITVDVDATLEIDPNYPSADVKAAVRAAVEEYIKGLALTGAPNVLYGRITNAIFNTEGVVDCTNLKVRANGGEWVTQTIEIPEDAMAVPGTITLR